MKLVFVVFRETGEHAVKDVVIPLVFVLSHDPRFLQEILVNSRPLYAPIFIKIDFYELSKSA